MIMTPSLILFALSIMVSIILMTSSPSLLISWVSLELNTMAFIPFILKMNTNSGEAALKYFLAQTLGSILLVISITCSFQLVHFLSSIIFLSAISLKLGAAPFHAWMPSMVNFMSWESFYLLLTIQKINPLILLTLNILYDYAMILSIFSLIVGCLMGLVQTQLRKLLVYSSINQIGWIMLASLESSLLMSLFFFVYLISVYPIVSLFKQFNLNTLAQLMSKKCTSSQQMMLYMNMLSLGGLPPFLGFFSKWIVLTQFIGMGHFLLSFILIFTSLLTLFFYIRVSLNAFLMNSNQWNFIKIQLTQDTILFTLINLMSLPIMGTLLYIW